MDEDEFEINKNFKNPQKIFKIIYNKFNLKKPTNCQIKFKKFQLKNNKYYTIKFCHHCPQQFNCQYNK